MVLPGWQGKAPIFVPSAVCKARLVLKEGHDGYAYTHSYTYLTIYSDTHLCLYACLHSVFDLLCYVSHRRDDIHTMSRGVRFSFLEPLTSPTASPRSLGSPRQNIFPATGHANIKINFSAFPCTSSKNSLVQIGNFFKNSWKSKIANLTIPGGMPALNVAAMHGNIIALHHLVSNGANLDKPNRIQKNTALHEACYGGHAMVILSTTIISLSFYHYLHMK